jgi:hypothetical protein
MAHEGLIGKHTHLFAKPENFTPPTSKEDKNASGFQLSVEEGRRVVDGVLNRPSLSILDV